MRKFPILQQHNVMDCGPTCIAMIAKYYGISLAAESIGLHAIGTQLNLPQLINEMQLPCILYWNQNHFVVLYEIKKKKMDISFILLIQQGECGLN